MVRAIMAVALFIACAMGCFKKKAASNPEDGPDATYILKFPTRQKGDKHEVMKSASMITTAKTKNSTQTRKEEYRYEFTEIIVDAVADDPNPTKVTRVYKTAEETDAKGDLRIASHVGKTITIEWTKEGYKYGVEGNLLPPAEQAEIARTFNHPWKLGSQFPKKAVKVGEEWQSHFASIAPIRGVPQATYDKEKSRLTSKLVRVYKKDGRVWGVIEVKMALVFAGALRGTLDVDGSYDIAIDGTLRAGTLKMTMKGTMETQDKLGNDVTTTLEGTSEESLTPVE